MGVLRVSREDILTLASRWNKSSAKPQKASFQIKAISIPDAEASAVNEYIGDLA
jgi:hypothetical protein